jgi:glycine oxidase
MGSEHVVVVGAGVVGLTIALRLRQRGFRVTILDRARPGAGASSAALGSLTPHSDHSASPTTRRLAESSIASYPSFVEELSSLTGLPIDYDAPGLLELAFDDDDARTLRSSFDSLVASNTPVEWLTSPAIHDLERELSPEATAAIYYKSEAIIDVAQLLEACERAVIIAGCTLVTNAPVTRLVVTGHQVVGVEIPSGLVRAPYVVLSPGTELSRIEEVPAISIERIRGEVIEVKGPPSFVGRHLYSGEGFMTPRRDGRVLLGSNYDTHVPGDDENTSTVSVRSLSRTLAATTRMVPGLSRFQLSRTWKSWRPRTPDGQPVIGWAGPKGLFIANGFFGLGITLAPAAAELAATLFMGGRAGDLEQLAPTRFVASRGEP